MTLLVHGAVGAATGTFPDGRTAALDAGAAGNVPLDLILHREFEKMWTEVAAEATFFGAALVAGHGRNHGWWQAVIAAGSAATVARKPATI